MYQILLIKAQQHADIREILFKTGKKPIIEINPNDKFWGGITNGPHIIGQNHLGFQWVRVRSKMWQQLCEEFENKSV